LDPPTAHRSTESDGIAVTLCSGAPQAFGTTCQDEPFQRRVRAFPGNPVSPTAHTFVEDNATTEYSWFGRESPLGFGLGTSRHEVPSQRTVSVVLLKDAKS
jgi:hypothetical protein